MVQQGIILLNSPPYKSFVNGQVERFNRTLRERILGYFITRNTFKWNDVLDDIVDNYNTSFSGILETSPTAARQDNSKYLTKSINRVFFGQIEETDLVVGQSVRLINKKKLFDKKSMTINWSKEVYEIESIVERRGQPSLFKLNNGLSRKFRFELQPIDQVQSNEDVQQNPTPPDEPQPESRMLQEILNRYREPEQTNRRPKITREINELNRIRAPLTSRRKK